MEYKNKITIKEFNEKYGIDAFQLAIENGFDEDDLLNKETYALDAT